jgi:eukaryotic-like serine/threonine-protein kinase
VLLKPTRRQSKKMDSERWQKIEEVFCEALERNASERASFLRQASGGDEELCREVESLLEAHQKASEFLEAPAADAASEWISGEIPDVDAGEKIGP